MKKIFERDSMITVKIKGIIPEPKVVRQIHEAGFVLQYVYNNNVLHLELKPKNIIQNKDEYLPIIDFGQSKQYE